ncbi:hypothetical protein [Nocardioides sp. InS609-2]|uniref:hypothetical protein n=1 Tax=Nocardioides sp. InS609-2 TaxID=2760705 RepID=UPI0020C02A02|nr:hypothetical protein [Nocardioides sp. InS609-2]
MTQRSRAIFIVGVLFLVLAGTTSVGWTYWRGAGSGAASGSTGSTQALTLSPGTPVSAVYPGGQSAVVVTVANPNTLGVRLESLALDTTRGVSGFAVDAGHSGCGTSALSYATQTNGGSGWNVPANASVTLTLAGALSMGTGAEDACQGASFTLYLRAGP